MLPLPTMMDAREGQWADLLVGMVFPLLALSFIGFSASSSSSLFTLRTLNSPLQRV